MSRYPRPAAPVAHRVVEILAGLDVRSELAPVADLLVTGVTHDSRDVRPGDLYVGLPGAHAHGADFAAAAATAGAVAMISDRLVPDLPTVLVDVPRAVLGTVAQRTYGHPSAAMDVIGVTGTNGKTTTTYLLEAGLRAAGRRTGLIGTVATRIVDEAVESVHTTPEATDLQGLFAAMRERAVDTVAMEVSSHGLSLGRVDGTRFAAAMFTNLTQDHLDFHGDMESYFKAKARLFEAPRSGVAVTNLDDAYGARLLERTRLPVLTFSAAGDRRADWTAHDVSVRADGATFRVSAPGVDLAVQIRLTGAYNVSNALGALATLSTIGVDLTAAAEGMAALPGVPGRLERVEAGQEFAALVDYAHSPDAVSALLQAVRPLTAGRILIVLGCGGDRDPLKRPLMGRAAAQHGDVLIATSDNPRHESPEAILDAMVAGAAEVPGADVRVELDRAAAIRLACALARPGDTVVVAGKGHEPGQQFGDEIVPFDDRVELRAALQEVLR